MNDCWCLGGISAMFDCWLIKLEVKASWPELGILSFYVRLSVGEEMGFFI